jgi:hypothetical protein
MPGANVSKALQQLMIRRADAAVNYQKAKMALAEVQAQIVRQGIKDGLINQIDIGGMYW